MRYFVGIAFDITGEKYGFSGKGNQPSEMKYGLVVVANQALDKNKKKIGPSAYVAFDYPCGYKGTFHLKVFDKVPWQNGMTMTCLHGALRCVHFPWALNFVLSAHPNPNLGTSAFSGFLRDPKSITFDEEAYNLLLITGGVGKQISPMPGFMRQIRSFDYGSETNTRKISGSSNR
jgi:hypothetical protein